MSTRTVKQKVLLSMQNTKRLISFINSGCLNGYSSVYYLENGLVNVKPEEVKVKYHALYRECIMLGKCKTYEDMYNYLKKTNKDYDSRFKKITGFTIDDYTKNEFTMIYKVLSYLKDNKRANVDELKYYAFDGRFNFEATLFSLLKNHIVEGFKAEYVDRINRDVLVGLENIKITDKGIKYLKEDPMVKRIAKSENVNV